MPARSFSSRAVLEFLEKRWYVLPILSGVLLELSFYPANLYLLSFVALAPTFYFVAGFPARPKWQVFWGGIITGSIFAFALSYFTVMQFHWLYNTYLFTDAIRWSVIPITLLGGLSCALSLLLYRIALTRSVLLNSLTGGAVYVLSEMLLRAIFGGYYLGMLAYAATFSPAIMSFAGLGGAFFVSFLIAGANAFIVQAIISTYNPQKRWEVLRDGVIAAAVLAVVFMGNRAYLTAGATLPVKGISVAVIQAGARGNVSFGVEKNGVFQFPSLATELQEASQGKPDLIIYPFSPVNGVLYKGPPVAFNQDILAAGEEAFGPWLLNYTSTTTAVMTWDTLFENDKFYNNYQFWQDGKVVSEYRKRDLFPFMDYTPAWAEKLGFYSTPVDAVPGAIDNQASINGIPVGSLLCSEVQQYDLARLDARRSLFIIAVGSEAIFADDVGSEFSLEAAQYRAAENDIPVIRGNLLGPTGIIDRDGSLLAKLDYGQGGIVRGVILLEPPHPTLFTLFGLMPFYLLLAGIGIITLIAHLRTNAKRADEAAPL